MRTIDLFAGGGGMTEGFKQAGFNSVYCNEFEKNAAETCTANHPLAIVSDKNILDIDIKDLRSSLKISKGDLDCLIGGPPCQGFSTYGKRNSKDPRNQLYLNYINFLDEFRPKTFVIENVMGLLSMSEGAVLEDICGRISKLGYSYKVNILNAVEFGVPQRRKRIFIVGGADGQSIQPPTTTHTAPDGLFQKTLGFDDRRPYVTTREAISDLSHIKPLTPKRTQDVISYGNVTAESDYQRIMRSNSSGLSHHSTKQMLGIRRLRLALINPGEYGTEIIKRAESEGLPYSVIEEILNGSEGIRDHIGIRKQDIEKENKLKALLNAGNQSIEDILKSIDSGGFKNKYRRLHWNNPSHTLVAHMSRDCSDFIHPDQDRFISVRESARLQSFSDNYIFSGSQFQQFLQIGNAVPPLLAKAVALSIAKELGIKNCGGLA